MKLAKLKWQFPTAEDSGVGGAFGVPVITCRCGRFAQLPYSSYGTATSFGWCDPCFEKLFREHRLEANLNAVSAIGGI